MKLILVLACLLALSLARCSSKKRHHHLKEHKDSSEELLHKEKVEREKRGLFDDEVKEEDSDEEKHENRGLFFLGVKEEDSDEEKHEKRDRRYYRPRPGQINQANQESIANTGNFGHSDAYGEANAGRGRRPGPGRPGYYGDQTNIANQQAHATAGHGGSASAGGKANAGGW